MRRWRLYTDIEFYIGLTVIIISLLYFLSITEFNINLVKAKYEEYKNNFIISGISFILSSIFAGFTYKKWYDKHYNHSNIENYKKGLKMPIEFETE